MSEATLTSKGQVTIPADIRKTLKLAAGDRLVFTQLDDGSTLMRAKTRSIMDLKGLLKPKIGKASQVAIEDMNIGNAR